MGLSKLPSKFFKFLITQRRGEYFYEKFVLTTNRREEK
jgi:hypothetical protein